MFVALFSVFYRPILGSIEAFGGRVHHALALAQASYLTEFPLPDAASRPMGIANGPDDAVWFTEYAANKIGRLTATGELREFPLPTAGSNPAGIVLGQDGMLWFTEYRANKIGRISRDGRLREFPLTKAKSGPASIAAGPDGALWFTETNARAIGRIAPNGTLHEFPLPGTHHVPMGIAPGPDGALWFTDADAVGRITVSGEVTFRDVHGTLHGIASASGALWLADPVSSHIIRLDPPRLVRVVPGFWEFASTIVSSGNGELWFGTGLSGSDTALVRLKADGTTTTFPYPTDSTRTHLPFENGVLFAPDGIAAIAADAAGAMWFTEGEDGKIGRIRPNAAPTSPA